MGRQPIRNPIPQQNIRIPKDFVEYIVRHRNSSKEPLYMVFRRMHHYFLENREDLFLESEQKTRTILALTERCRELEKQQWSFE